MTQFPVSQTTLDNGLRVVVCEDHNAPVAAVNIWYGVGSRHEPAGKTGFAHLFEHIMFQGSRSVAATEHFTYVQAVGGTLNGTTSFDRTNYFETVPNHALELVYWLESDRMGTLLDALTQENLDNQRDVVKNERRQSYDNQPYGTSWEHLFAMAFPAGHPYHHLPIGSMEDLDAASLEDCRNFFTTYYAPDNAVLTVVGDVVTAQAVAQADRYFGGIPRSAGVPPAPDGAIRPATEPVLHTLREDVPAEAAYLAFRCPPDGTPDCEALSLAMRVLSEGGSSRLVSRLSRRDELALDVEAGVERLVGGVSVAYVAAHARTDAALDTLQAALDEELALLVRDGVTLDELERAKAQAERAFLDEVTTASGLADELSRQAMLFGDPDRVNRTLDDVAAVTTDDVQRVAAEWLQPQSRALLEYRLDGESA